VAAFIGEREVEEDGRKVDREQWSVMAFFFPKARISTCFIKCVMAYSGTRQD
jgi:hypothetical protein